MKEKPEFQPGWREEFKSTIKLSIELTYKTEILRHYTVSDIIERGDKFLIKWVERWVPLTDEELKEKYGR
jgi:hypothetical protein